MSSSKTLCESHVSPSPFGQAQADPWSRAQGGEKSLGWLDKADDLRLLTESSAAWNFPLKTESCLLCSRHADAETPMQRALEANVSEEMTFLLINYEIGFMSLQ